MSESHTEESGDDRPAKRVLPDYREGVVLFGRTVSQWFIAILVVALPFILGPFVLSMMQAVAAVVVTVLFVGILFLATPEGESPWEWGGQRIRHATQQSRIVFNRYPPGPDGRPDPSASGLTQPPPTSLIEQVARMPVIRRLPIVGAGLPIRTQDIVPVDRPHRGEYGIERADGWLLGFVRVTPAPMTASASSNDWRSQVETFGETLASKVDFPLQVYDPMRAVDYTNRRDRWQAEADRIRRQPAAKTSVMDAALGDVAAERASNIELYGETTSTRDHLLIVTASPEDAARAIGVDPSSGGLATVPLLGRFVTWRRKRALTASDELESELETILDQRVRTMKTAMQGLDRIDAHALPSESASQVIADYFSAVDRYAQADFTSLIRQSPTPASEVDGDGDAPTDPGDPYHAVEYQAADVVYTREMETEQYRSLLATNEFDRDDPTCVTLRDTDTIHAATIAVKNWPPLPTDGMFSEILSAAKPGVDITMSSHLMPHNVGDDFERTKASLRYKYEDAKKKKSFRVHQHKENYETAEDMAAATTSPAHSLMTGGSYISVRAYDKARLDEEVNNVLSMLPESPANAGGNRLDFDHTAGFQTTAPLAVDKVNQRTIMRNDGAAAIFPWSTQNLYEPGGVEFGMHDERDEPIVLDLFSSARDPGFNFGIFGDTGSGKTTTLGKIVLGATTTYNNLLGGYIDPLGEFTNLCRLYGGEHVVVGSDEMGFNPLNIEETPESRLEEIGRGAPFDTALRRAKTFVETYYDVEGLDFTGKKTEWELAFEAAYEERGITRDPATHHKDPPTLLDDVIPVFERMANNPKEFVREGIADQSAALNDRRETAIDILNNDISAFEKGGVYHFLARESTLDTSNSNFIYYDLSLFENERERAGFIMQTLIGDFYERQKGRDGPAVLGTDESHYMFSTLASVEGFKKMIRHARHLQLALGFSTQTISEFFEAGGEGDGEYTLTNAADVIFNNMAWRVYHALDEMDMEFGTALGLSEAEVEYHDRHVRPGNPDLGYSTALLEVRQKGSYPLKVEMDTDLNPREFTILEYEPSNHGDDFEAYLRRHNDVCDWSWLADGEGVADGVIGRAERNRVERGTIDDPRSRGRGTAETDGGQTRGGGGE